MQTKLGQVLKYSNGSVNKIQKRLVSLPEDCTLNFILKVKLSSMEERPI
jgi:hypothetical protein